MLFQMSFSIVMKEKYGKLMFEVDFDGEIDKALIQRCVDKGLFDDNFLQKAIDMEMMALGRRIINQSKT